MTMKECVNCEDRISLYAGNVSHCKRCGFPLDPEVIAFNKEVEFAKNIPAIASLVPLERNPENRNHLKNTAFAMAQKLYRLYPSDELRKLILRYQNETK